MLAKFPAFTTEKAGWQKPLKWPAIREKFPRCRLPNFLHFIITITIQKCTHDIFPNHNVSQCLLPCC